MVRLLLPIALSALLVAAVPVYPGAETNALLVARDVAATAATASVAGVNAADSAADAEKKKHPHGGKFRHGKKGKL